MQDERLRASLGNALVRLFRLVNRIHNRALADHGLSAEQAHILSVLWLVGPMTMGALQRHVALSSGTLTGAIDRMEAQSLVRRIPSPADRRAFLLEPRVPARSRARIETTLDATETRIWAGLSPTERRDLLRLLHKSIAHLDPDAAAR
ncbi:MAG TPA: MarR family transcriptional regulator [Kofleriaceae bacterium]|nr:MarR family transcriptional regulator [Kofleriaceae bacterium]